MLEDKIAKSTERRAKSWSSRAPCPEPLAFLPIFLPVPLAPHSYTSCFPGSAHI